jgi:predicted nucleic acid-binding protein
VIVVDSSVWIAHLRDVDMSQVRTLRTIAEPDDVLVGDLILLEVLQGARSEAHAALIERQLRQFAIANMSNSIVAPQVARNDRILRDRGVTARKTIDLIISTFCIAGGHRLLHADRDFEPMVEHLGLRTV